MKKNNNSVTAVEWFEQQLYNLDIEIPFSIIEQAKEMEKQQIIDAYENGYSDSDNTFALNPDYYNETFKNK